MDVETRPAGRQGRRGAREGRSPISVFALAFVLLLGAGIAVVVAQFTASRLAAWISIGYSVAAVVLTLVALSIPTRR